MEKDKLFNFIYRDNQNAIFRTCYMILKDYQLAEDATQETFYRVYCKLNSFRRKSNIKTWVTQIAINLCKDKLRKKSSGEVVTDEFYIPQNTDIGADVEDKILLVQAVTDLELPLREVVVLYFYRDLTHKEIAKILKIPQTTVSYRLRTAREILKNKMKEDFDYE